jgi:hypothetical protein
MNTLAMSVNDLSVIVNSSNSFNREVLTAYREEIRTLRAEKKARLMALTPSQIAMALEAKGLFLVAEKQKVLRNGTPVVTLTFKGCVSEQDSIKAKIAKLTAMLEKSSLKNAN